ADNSKGVFSDSLLMSSAQEIQSAAMYADNSGNIHTFMEYTLDFTNFSLFAMRSGECSPSAVNVPEIDRSALKVFPNPVSSSATLTVEQLVKGYVRIDLYDASGKKAKTVYDGNLPNGATVFNIDFDHLPEGLYLLRLQSETGVVTRKII